MNKNITISVEDSADELGIRNILLIGTDGNVSYHVQSNRESPHTQEIGRYATRLDETTLTQIHKVFEAPEFKNMADHWGQVVSGEVVRFVKIKDTNDELVKLISSERTTPADYEPVKKTIDQLKASLIKHPVYVLRIDVKWPDQNVLRGRISPVSVTFTNIGEKKVAFVSPFMKQPSGASHVFIRAKRTDVDLMALREYHYIHQEISPACVKPGSDHLPSNNALIEIDPQGSIVFYLDIPFDWPPGPYLSQVIWEDNEAKETAFVLFGILYSSKQPVIVMGDAKPGDEKLGFEDDDSELDE